MKQAELTIVNGDIDCVPYANKSIYSILCKIIKFLLIFNNYALIPNIIKDCARDNPNLSSPSKMSNICYGDSGGPMLYKIGNIWYLYGITSFTLANKNASCNPTRPSFFTSVPNFKDWINQNVNNHGSINLNYSLIGYIIIIITTINFM